MTPILFFFPEVEGRLHAPLTPLTPEDGSETLENFVRSCYVWARDEPEGIMHLEKSYAEEGALLVSTGVPERRSAREIPENVRPRFEMRSTGIAWKSGRVFFPSD